MPGLGRQRAGGQGWHQLVTGVRQQHQRLAVKVALHGGLTQLAHLAAQQRARQIPRQLEQRLRPPLPAAGNPRLKPQVCGQLPNQQTHDQHHRKRQQVLHVTDGKRKARLHKKEVKRRHIQHRRQRLGKVGKQHGEPQPQRHGKDKACRRFTLAAQGLQAQEGGQNAADVDHKHHRVAPLHARAQLGKRLQQGGLEQRRVQQNKRFLNDHDFLVSHFDDLKASNKSAPRLSLRA